MEDSEEGIGWNKRGGARKLYSCHKFDCDYTTFEKLPKCPECGFPLYDADTYKIFGVLLALIGLFFTAIGVGLTLLLLLRTGRDPEMKYLIYGLAAMLILMGLALLTGGIKQTVTGLKSSSFIGMFLVLLVIVGVIVAVIRFVAG